MTSPHSSFDGGSPKTSSSAFERLHEGVRRWIWGQGWTELRDIQERAVEPILGGAQDVIIAAATAGGKTEAAFLPICSKIAERKRPGLEVLCVSPLKALINDQFSRLEDLCKEIGVPVHRWHGDVSAGRKQEVLHAPDGILLITPESLEALFVNRGTALARVFEGLAYVVVDELHVFIGSERGRQLQSLLHRLELVLRRGVPRIALSATLGDMAIAAEFLRPGQGRGVQLLVSTGGGQEVKLQLRGYRVREAPEKRSLLGGGSSGSADEEKERPLENPSIVGHLFDTLRGNDNLVFANARSAVEAYADSLRRMSERVRVPNEFWPHHGSLSRDLREDVESRLKDRSVPLTAVCTSTLELGIDIGSVASIAQIGPPPSVASMRQRLGRSGRRGEPSILRLYIEEPEITPRTSLQDTLRPQLVQTIAMVDLLTDKWYEPPTYGALHMSTLIQQILSMIAERGGITAARAWESLSGTGPFRSVTKEMFAELLRALNRADLVTQTHEGDLVLGLAGERLVNHYDFYTAFATNEEYRIEHAGRALGSLPVPQAIIPGEHIIFAGRRWRVLSVDDRHKVIGVAPSEGRRVPLFSGVGGACLHDRIRQVMFEMYCSTNIPTYLDAEARDLLAEGRRHFGELGLSSQFFVQDGKDSLLFCWRGDRVMDTVVTLLNVRGLHAMRDGIAITVHGASEGDVLAHVNSIASTDPPDARALASSVANKRREKYDHFLTEELLDANFASRNLDPGGAHETLRGLLGHIRSAQS